MENNTTALELTFHCKTGTIEDILHVTGARKGRTNAKFLNGCGALSAATVHYGGKSYTVIPNKQQRLNPTGLPPVIVGIKTNDKKVWAVYALGDEKDAKEERENRYRQGYLG